MDSTDQQDEKFFEECVESDSSEPTQDKDPSTNLITGFLWLFFLFMATTYLSQSIIIQSLNNFLEEVKNTEEICEREGNSFNAAKCECVFKYLEGLDHPQFQVYFHKLKLPGIDSSKKNSIDLQSNPEGLYIDPTVYVVGCGNNSPEREFANKEVCEKLDKLIITDLYTKWWYDPDALCFNSILNTIKRVHPGMILAFVLILLGIVLTPIRLLKNFAII